MNGYVVAGSAFVGLLVGLTGAGGGALMTPMLMLLFSVKPAVAISSDLVAAVVMRPFGAAVHLRRGTIDKRLVVLMAAGSVPAALAGSYLLHLLGASPGASEAVERCLGATLLAGAAAMAVRALMDHGAPGRRDGAIGAVALRPLPTVAVGALGGLVVGFTSVGSGSLMIVMLMFVYPTLTARSLVGTDLMQAVPLTGAAALGALAFGRVQLPLTTAVIVGAVPAVLVGSWLSSRVSDSWLRPAIFCVVLASGARYAGLGNTAVAALAGGAATLLVAAAAVTSLRDDDRRPVDTPEPENGEEPAPACTG